MRVARREGERWGGPRRDREKPREWERRSASACDDGGAADREAKKKGGEHRTDKANSIASGSSKLSQVKRVVKCARQAFKHIFLKQTSTPGPTHPAFV